MIDQYRRAQMLISQGRFELAERELHLVLGENPDDGIAHSLLSICISTGEDRFEEATREAEMGVTLEPDSPFAHFVHSRILWKRSHYAEAYEAVSEAIRLDPYDADYFAMAAQIKMSMRNWEAGLKLAQQGLAIDPEDSDCNNLRTLALERLGRTSDAVKSSAENLKNSPDDSFSHAAHGWALLNAGNYKEAQTAFRESLRLDPTNTMARDGMIDAISSRSFLFRVIRKFHITLSRLSHKHQFAIIFGAWILIQILSGMGDNNPWLRPLIPVILMLYMVFAVLTWTSDAIFNTLLRFHSFGRHLLTPKLIWRSNLVAPCLICAAAGALFCVAMGHWYAAIVVSFYWLLMCVPATAAFAMPTLKRSLVVCAAGLVIGLLPVLGVLESISMESTAPLATRFRTFNWGIIGLQVAVGFMAVAPSRR